MLRKACILLVIALIFAGCKNDLEILAPYKQSVAVYGMLNQDDTVQYIRVQRVFLGEGNALVMAQNADSAWFKPGELKVSLQRLKNGVPVSVDNPASAAMEIVLTETFVPTAAGVFNSNQLTYKTKHALYEDSQYRLLIHNNKTNADFSSEPVSLIGTFSNKLTYGQQGSQLTQSYAFINIVPSFGGTVVCKYGSPANSGVCGLKLRFYYTEYKGSTAEPKSIDIDLGVQYTTKITGDEEIDLSYVGDAMLGTIASMIPVDQTVGHRTADSLRYLMNAGGPEVALYNQINGTSTISQDKPIYTNIKGGVGIFSVRREYYVRKRFSTQCLDRLASDAITCPLKFYGAGGSLLTCQ